MSEEKELKPHEKQQLLMRSVFSTPQGKALLKELADEYIYHARFSDNANKTFFALGKQELVVEFINSLESKA